MVGNDGGVDDVVDDDYENIVMPYYYYQYLQLWDYYVTTMHMFLQKYRITHLHALSKKDIYALFL